MNDYIKTVWKGLPDTSTPITADRLNNIEDGIEYLFEHGVGGGDTLPIGIILPFSDDTIPEGYMLCDGRAISRTTYSRLFSVIGTTYGAGDGSTTFNLPNLKGKVPVGYDSTDSDFDTLGETGGEKTHVLADNELPNTTNKYLSNASSGLDWGVQSGTSYSFKGVSLGSGEAHNNLQPYQVVNYIIKVLNAQNGEVRSESLPVGTELDFDGTSQQIPTGWEEITNPDSYSTNEVKTNKVWIDNKPIYRRVVDLGFLGTQTQISYGNQIDTITSFGGYIYQDNGANMSLIEYTSSLWRAITYTITSQHTMNVVINRSDTSAWSDWRLKIVIEYTKTTD